MRLIAMTISALTVSTAVAAAQESDRFALEKTADGYVRMDKVTGEMSICKEQGGQLICRIAADDRRALEDDVARLDERLSKIEEKLANTEGVVRQTGPALPSDEEFERTLGFMEKFIRRFMGVVKEVDDGTNGPQKT